MYARAFTAVVLQRKNSTRFGAKVKPQKNFKIMTAVFSNSNFFTSNYDNELRSYTIEVITFGGESYTFEIEAENAEEAQAQAASLVEDADYTMVQGVA